MKICSIHFDRDNVSSPDVWYKIFTKLSVEHLFGIRKEGKKIISIDGCNKVSSNVLETLTKNIYDENMVNLNIIEGVTHDVKVDFFNFPYDYIMAWCGIMNKVADLFQISYEYWFEKIED